jgi:hypothetical protein
VIRLGGPLIVANVKHSGYCMAFLQSILAFV